jgi:hypothetical protein
MSVPRDDGRRLPASARPSADEIDALLLSWVRGEEVVLPPLSEDGCADVLLRIDFHGVAGLIAPRIGDLGSVPATLRAGIVERVVAAEVWEAEHLRILRRVLSALGDAGIKPLLLKGTGVAYRCYDPPSLRRRGDTDVLVPPDKFETAIAALIAVGGSARDMPAGPVEGCARHVVFRSVIGTQHEFDVHFDLSGHPALRRLLSWEGLTASAVPLPALNSAARACSDVDALVIAAMHRLKHRQAGYYAGGVRFLSPDRIIWLYDIHLLAQSLDAENWHRLVERAGALGLSGAVAMALEASTDALGTSCAPGMIEALKARGVDEAATRFLMAGAFGQTMMDLGAMQGRDKFRYIAKLAFPPATHMRETFSDVRPNWLPWLYLYRAGKGFGIYWRGDWGGAR